MSREAISLALEALDKHDYEMADHILSQALQQTDQVAQDLAIAVAGVVRGTHEITGVTIKPKREWRGLTDQDVHECFNLAEWTHNLDFRRDPEAWCKAFASELEETLKARNT